MDRKEILKLYGFYENELTNNILSFWVPRCVDQEYGGFLNCFDNRGENLVSHDKYIWSQGRFVWLFPTLPHRGSGVLQGPAWAISHHSPTGS